MNNKPKIISINVLLPLPDSPTTHTKLPFGITKLKIHAFLTLMVAAIFVGMLSGPLPELSIENKGLFQNRVDLPTSSETDYTLAIKWSGSRAADWIRRDRAVRSIHSRSR